MDKERLHKELILLGEQICRTFRAIMASNVGINDRTGTNTLIGSNLYESVDYKVSQLGSTEVVDIIVNHYVQYVNDGLKPGVWVPIRALREWAFRKGLPTDNGFVYAVQRSIYNRGIKARPILDRLESQINTVWEEWANNVFFEFTEEINRMNLPIR